MTDRPQADRPARLPLIALLLAALALTAVIAVAAVRRSSDAQSVALTPANPGPFRGGVLPKGIDRAPAPDFRLRDASGGRVDTRELRGKPYALTFLYVECPDVCPLIGQEIRAGLELLGSRADEVAVVAVSVDPQGDTPEAVRAWLKRHRLPRNFHYLIGDERELKPVWDAYYAAPQIPGRAQSAHTASIWLIDARGRWRTKFSAGAPVAPKDLAHDFRVLLQETDRRAAAADAGSRG